MSISTTSYFTTQAPPPQLEHDQAKAQEFISRMKGLGRRVVLVTSGGTSVPLEKNMVRFLDNFSAGTRGATSAEYFLSHPSYSVIFLHRQHSLLPFSRHYSHSTRPFLDLLTIKPDVSPSSSTSAETSSSSKIEVHPPEISRLLPILAKHHQVQEEGTLLTIPFVTVNEYLWLLRGISQVMGSEHGVGRHGLFYLAAAVSDFYLPEEKMAEHKIQSGPVAGSDGRLTLVMDQVPKILKPLVSEWTKEGYVVSFKLETDESLLLPKARGALDRYNHQMVIGNDLHRRKFEVVFVEPASSSSTPSSSSCSSATTNISNEGSERTYDETWIRLEGGRESTEEIEKVIVESLVERHGRWIERVEK
ncbi:Uncharacterized conserved protein with similarity to phosphopantothenoylcysteine synthetase/decarboxylase [Phaffia rhodozyma]|uniref:Uncharacterized conserved protein with similarity to phosphopantothenoylcysteine synthetase/decarboxylase n=1 Tax=Phaffia rhodozyma TaxID=264483 RepID=A0A0F7SQ06_PHARH|nr:Uncharacterized conserved protein with similarity to phosphopantothenoylcysteine synthetase/decarboxylase [Phaffia rhodozyma]